MLETEKIELEKRWLEQPKSAQSGCTGLSGGAPDSVRCVRLAWAKWLLSGLRRRCTAKIHRTVRCAPDCPVGRSQANSLLSGNHQRRTAKIHRSVRWCTGLSGESTVSRANGRPRIPRVTRGRANGHIGAPDGVRCANGSQTPTVGFAK